MLCRTIRCIHALCAVYPCLQGGRKLGKGHVRKLLKAVRRDCLEGMTTTEQKVSALSPMQGGGMLVFRSAAHASGPPGYIFDSEQAVTIEMSVVA